MHMNYRQGMDEKSAKEAYEIANKVYTTGKPVKGYLAETIRKDGSKVYGEISISLMRDSKGDPIGFRGIVRDVTNRSEPKKKKGGWKPNSNKAKRWRPLSPWPAALPIISTTP